ncbi:MAG: hypothetical protein LUD22_04130 [Coprobacillus sp.]|nr:hypothetical protein [Coprobacillus sp.]
MDSFIDTLKTNFKENTPILHEEILSLFSSFDSPRINNLINNEIKKGNLIRYIKGVYYLPKRDPLTLVELKPTPLEVMNKKYIYSNGNYYGLYSGLSLLNTFGLSKEIPSSYYIVSSKESSLKRELIIDGVSFTLSKSRVPVTNKNLYTYMLVELVYLNKDKKITGVPLEKIKSFIKTNHISKEDTKEIMNHYPSRIYYDMIHSGIYQLL